MTRLAFGVLAVGIAAAALADYFLLPPRPAPPPVLAQTTIPKAITPAEPGVRLVRTVPVDPMWARQPPLSLAQQACKCFVPLQDVNPWSAWQPLPALKKD